MLVAGAIIGLMYLCLVFCIAEMSPALPHTGAAYSFARTSMGPWGGFITGLCENVEYVVTPTVVAFFIGAYLNGILDVAGIGQVYPPYLWVATFAVFLLLNILGVALSFRVTMIVTLLSLAVLVVFWISAIPNMDFSKWALNIASEPQSATIAVSEIPAAALTALPSDVQAAIKAVTDPAGSVALTMQQLGTLPADLQAKAATSNLLPEGNGPMFPFGWWGVLATLPFAVWLFLAIEQLPLAAEESVDPKRDMPKGILLGMVTLIVSAFMIVLLNPSVIGVGAHKLSTSGEPLLDGFRAIYGSEAVVLLGVIALTGLIASFHTILFAMGRQVYSLSRAGYFPTVLSVTGHTLRTPYVAMIVGSLVGLSLMFFVYKYVGEAKIGTTLLNMAVFGAMLSYILQAVSFIILRSTHAHIERPYRSPLGVLGAMVTILIAAVTLGFQLYDPAYREAILWVVGWFAVGILYFALVGRNRLILSPEEEFAMEHKAKAGG
jgi:ethanolamine permease